MKKYLTVFFDRKNDIIVDNCTGLKNKSDFWLWHVFSNISVDIFWQKVYFPQLLYVFIPNFLVPVPPLPILKKDDLSEIAKTSILRSLSKIHTNTSKAIYIEIYVLLVQTLFCGNFECWTLKNIQIKNCQYISIASNKRWKKV